MKTKELKDSLRLNCLSAGSVSLTSVSIAPYNACLKKSQLPFGWVCFSNGGAEISSWTGQASRLNCLSAGSVSLTDGL